MLDAYAARSCPLKTVNAFDPTLPPPPRPSTPPPFFADPEVVEAEVVRLLADGVASLVDLRPLRDRPAEEQEAATLAALADGVDVVIAGLLPRDWAAHRSGRPSLLLRPPDGDGYFPVQIKFHQVLQSAPAEEKPVTFSTLAAPRAWRAWPGRRFPWGRRLNAGLQVAHYRRLLEASGFAAPAPWAGLIGTDRVEPPDGGRRQPEPVITWLDLAAPVVPPNPRAAADPASAPLISCLARYDDEHEYRVRLATAAQQGPAREGALVPIFNRECLHCRWHDHCVAQLDGNDLSLRIVKAPLGVHEVRILRELGVFTVAQLAAADQDALIADYLPRVAHVHGAERRLVLARRRARLLEAGITLERHTTGPLDLPAHDLEIDLDIETSSADRVYLWGFGVDDRASGQKYYHEVSVFDDLDAAGERALALRAFTWLRDLVAGRDAAVYHYSDYEVIRLTRLSAARRGPDAEVSRWVRAFAAEHFVDLFPLLREHFFGAHGLGLKAVATAVTSFRWRDEDPGGLNSQRWFDDACHAPSEQERRRARVRVLEYNEDDVSATWHLRRWLRSLT